MIAAMSAVMVKCSEPKTAKGIAKNSRPNGMILSTPCSCGSSPKILMRPMMKSNDAQTYIQNAIAGMPNGAEAKAGTTTTNCWICNAGRPPPVNSSGDILEFPTRGSNQIVTGAQDSRTRCWSLEPEQEEERRKHKPNSDVWVNESRSDDR